MPVGDQNHALRPSPLERFARARADGLRRRRAEIQVQPAGSDRRYAVELLGLQSGGQRIFVTAPVSTDRSLIAVRQGQLLQCHWVNPSTVFQFSAAITRLVFEPTPMLHLGDLHAIRIQPLRGLPRARAVLPALLRGSEETAARVTDLSVGGAQIAVGEATRLAVGQQVELALRATLFGTEFALDLACRVAGDQGAPEPAHPAVHFYGLVFLEPTDNDRLVLHGIVQEQLARDADRLGQLLLSASDT